MDRVRARCYRRFKLHATAALSLALLLLVLVREQLPVNEVLFTYTGIGMPVIGFMTMLDFKTGCSI